MSAERVRSWRKIWTYVALVAVLTLVATYAVTHLDLPPRLKAFVGMWMPGLSAITVRLLYDRSLAGLGLGKSGGKWLLVGLLLPLAYAIPVYMPVWLSGSGGFDPNRWSGTAPYFGGVKSVAASFALLLTVGLFDKFGRALGEEIGWRGFLAPELMSLMPLWQAGLISGAIWFAWHLPAIFFEGYNSGGPSLAYQIGCFAVMVIPSGIIYAWVRDRSESVWPCAMLHAAHNLFIQSFLDKATVNGPSTLYITGEFGFGLAVTSTVAALAILLLTRGGHRERVAAAA